MTVCRVKRVGLAAALVLGLPLVALAQTAPSYPPGFDPDTMELADPPPPGTGIRIDSKGLSAPDPEAVGPLSPANGGLPLTVWDGMPSDLVRSLITLLPSQSPSPVVRSLERRLLLSAAIPPAGTKAAAQPSLLDLRAERLMAMGDMDGLNQLTGVAPASVAGPMAQRARIEANLIGANLKDACPDVMRLAPDAKDATLTKAHVACLFLAGRTLEANMALDPYRAKTEPDQAFVMAAETIGGLPAPAADKVKLDQLTPLHLALFSAAKLPVPQGLLAKATPPLSKTISQAPALSPDIRLAAAERAFGAGLLPVEEMRKAYLAAVFAPDEMGAPLQKADAMGTKGLALLYRAATDQPDPVIRADFVAKALERGLALGQGLATIRVFAPLVADIKPDAALASHGLVFARAQLVLNNRLTAGAWLETAKTAAASSADKPADKPDLALWPLLAVQHPEPAKMVTPAHLAEWKASLSPDQAPRKLAVALGVLSGLGAKIPATAWAETVTLPPGAIQPGLFALVQGGALETRLGGTIAPLLIMLGDRGLDKVDPLTLSESVSALAVLGLMDDARALATEALLANGL